METKRMIIIAMLTTIMLVLEQVMVILPNIQLTTLLIVLFSKHFKLKESIIMIIVYVILDSLWMGAFNLFYMIPMIIGWSVIPITIHLVFKKPINIYKLATFGMVMGFIYGWTFVPFNVFMTGVPIQAYLIADLPFQIMMGVTNFLTILWLYQPLDSIYKVYIPSSL
jgi:hypothetical protein